MVLLILVIFECIDTGYHAMHVTPACTAKCAYIICSLKQIMVLIHCMHLLPCKVYLRNNLTDIPRVVDMLCAKHAWICAIQGLPQTLDTWFVCAISRLHQRIDVISYISN